MIHDTSVSPARTPAPPAATTSSRIVSLDVFRGLTMIWMISEGFGLLAFRNDETLGWLAYQFQHEPWHGMRAWDLIQPFFMFIVGAAMPFSFARRWAAGEPWSKSLRHVLRRSALLILFGLIARSVQAGRPVLDLINVLAQIAVTYFIAFLVLRKHWAVQGAVALGLLAGHWALYHFASAPGVTGPWDRDANIGWYLDRALLGKNWGGSYATINCISSAANTIFGVMAGALLMSSLPSRRKLAILAGAGVLAVGAGLMLDPVVPINKKIWTASFAIYSTGFTLLALALFHWVCDVLRWQRWTKLFVIVGANSIFIYLFHEILNRWLHSASNVMARAMLPALDRWAYVVAMCIIIAFQIFVCWVLYRRRIFLKI